MASPQVSTGAATQAPSQPIENHFRNSGGVGVLLSHAQDFGLSAAQIDQLEAMRPTFELARHDLQAALLKAETQLRAVLQNDTAAENEVMTAIDDVARCQGELLKMRYRNLQKARDVLTDEQRSKVKAFRRQQDLASAEQRRQ
jgi:Spy/CpxP family protein refolding chaperone